MTKLKVKVIDTATGEVIKEMAASSQRQADRLDDGLNINLNHAKFHTTVEEAREETTP